MGAAKKASSAPDPQFKKDMENLKTIPKGPDRTMSFMELLLLGGTGGRGAIGRAGGRPSIKATARIDSPKTTEAPVEKEEQDTFKSDFDDVKKRLLDKAKEEKIQKQNQLSKEKQVYDKSLPNSTQKNPYG